MKEESEKTTYCMLPTTGRTGKGKTVETGKYQWLLGEEVAHRHLGQ